MDSTIPDESLSSIKARVDALRKGSAGDGPDPVNTQGDQQKKFSVDATAQIEEGVITMARSSEEKHSSINACEIEDDDTDSELDREFQNLHPEHADTADNYEDEELQSSYMSKRTKMMIAGGVAAFGLLAYGAASMVSAVKGKRDGGPVSLSLQSAAKSTPLLAAQPRISSAVAPNIAPTAFAKMSSAQKQQSVTPVAAPAVVQALPSAPIAPAAPGQKLTQMQSAQLRAVPQLAVQRPVQAAAVVPQQQVAPVAPVKAEEPKEAKKQVEAPKKTTVNKKRKILAKKRIRHDDDYIPERTKLAKTKTTDDVLAILEHARNSQ